jgi:hypothetical protein
VRDYFFAYMYMIALAASVQIIGEVVPDSISTRISCVTPDLLFKYPDAILAIYKKDR